MAGKSKKPDKKSEKPRGRGRPKSGPKVPFHVEIDPALMERLRQEIERQRRTNRAVTEDMIEKYLKSHDLPGSAQN